MEFWQLAGGHLGTSSGWIWWIRDFLLKSLRKTLESQREAMGLGLGPKYEIRYPQVNWHDWKIAIFSRRYYTSSFMVVVSIIMLIFRGCKLWHHRFNKQLLHSHPLDGKIPKDLAFRLFFHFQLLTLEQFLFKKFYVLNLRYLRDTIRYFCQKNMHFCQKA